MEHKTKISIFNQPVFQIIVICLLGILLYGNTLQHSFQFDDRGFIVDNKAIRDIKDIKAIWEALETPTRFIGYYTFALNYHFHKLDVAGYHIVNIFIHLMASCFVYWLIRLIFLTPRMANGPASKDQNLIAFFVALLFISHPVQTQAVTYIGQRFASLATLFYVGSICFYLKARMQDSYRFRRFLFFLATFIFAVLGTMTKEVAITLPFMMILTEYIFFHPRGDRSQRAQWFMLVLLVLVMLIIPLSYSFRIVSIFREYPSESHIGDIISFWPYVLTQLRVFTTFGRLLVLPIHQNLDYDFPLSQSIFEASTLLSFIGVLLALWIAVKCMKRYPLISFGIFWLFITFSANLIPRHNVIFEHKLYLISSGFFICICYGLFLVIKDIKKWMIALCSVILVFSYLTVQRNAVWLNNVTLWGDVVKKSPHKARGYNNLGMAYLKRNQYNSAFENFNKAVALDPQYAKALNNRGNAYFARGQYHFALNDYHQALRISPHKAIYYKNRGTAYFKIGEFNLALKDFAQAIKLNPQYVGAYTSRAKLYNHRKSYDLALRDTKKALEYDPNYIEALNNRGIAYTHMKQYEFAVKDFLRILEIDSSYSHAYNNLKYTYQLMNASGN